MNFIDQFQITDSYQPDCRLVKGMELQNYLSSKGWTHIAVDDNGRFSGMDADLQIYENKYLFHKKIPHYDSYITEKTTAHPSM